MSERERFEAWADSKGVVKDHVFREILWEAWQAARSGQAASGSQENARSDVQNGVGQPEAPTAAPLEPAAWADDRAIAGGIGNVVSAATKAYWERSHTIDRAMAARMVHPLYAHPPARSGAGSEDRKDESWK